MTLQEFSDANCHKREDFLLCLNSYSRWAFL